MECFLINSTRCHDTDGNVKVMLMLMMVVMILLRGMRMMKWCYHWKCKWNNLCIPFCMWMVNRFKGDDFMVNADKMILSLFKYWFNQFWGSWRAFIILKIHFWFDFLWIFIKFLSWYSRWLAIVNHINNKCKCFDDKNVRV